MSGLLLYWRSESESRLANVVAMFEQIACSTLDGSDENCLALLMGLWNLQHLQKFGGGQAAMAVVGVARVVLGPSRSRKLAALRHLKNIEVRLFSDQASRAA